MFVRKVVVGVRATTFGPTVRDEVEPGIHEIEAIGI
jgi:hypothetical protein